MDCAAIGGALEQFKFCCSTRPSCLPLFTASPLAASQDDIAADRYIFS